MANDTLAWLRWVLVPQLGLKRSQQLLTLVDSPEALFLHPERWPLPESIKATLREMNFLGEQHPVHRRALEQLHWAEHENHHLILPESEHYPESLAMIDDAPLMLWAEGDLALLNNTQVGVVGSRHASGNALRHARTLSRELASAGITITSGGAKGIDASCHQAANEHPGRTIAVLGCGVDVVYPKINRQLFSQIKQSGLVISEYPLGTQPKPGHFPRRNRLISALSEVIVVVEAALKSGSLVTAAHALEQGKDIFAMPGDIGNPNSEGCHHLIQQGAYLLSHSRDIVQHLNWQHDAHPPAKQQEHNFSPLQQQIIEALQAQEQPLDMLAHLLQTPVHQLLEPILELELLGCIEQLPGGYCLCNIA